MFTSRVLTTVCKRSPVFLFSRGNLEKVILGQCVKLRMPEKSSMMFMPIQFSNFSTEKVSEAPADKLELTGEKVAEATEKPKKKRGRKPGTTSKSSTKEETPKSKKKLLVKTASALTSTANYYKTILNRVADTCQIYLQASAEERSKIPAGSRFYYVREIIDSLDQEEQASFLQYLLDRESFFAYETFNKQKLGFGKNGRIKNYKIKAFKVEEHPDEKERVYMYKNSSKSKKRVHNYLQEPNNGPILHELILKFLDAENSDFKWYTSYDEDEKTIGKIVQKEPVRGEKQDTRNVIKTSLELIKKRWKSLDRKIRK